MSSNIDECLILSIAYGAHVDNAAIDGDDLDFERIFAERIIQECLSVIEDANSINAIKNRFYEVIEL